MNRILSLIGVILVVGCGEPVPRDLNELMIQGETYLDPETFELYSGPVFLPSGRSPFVSEIQQRFTLRDGVRHGPYEEYFDNRELYEKGTYKEGEKCGEWLEDGETVTHDPC